MSKKKGYQWTVIYRMDEAPKCRFTKEEQETLRYLADHGLAFASAYPSPGINFGIKLENAKGWFPFVCPTDDQGEAISYTDLCNEDRIILNDAQHWSILQAYLLGLENGKSDKATT